MRTVRCTSTRFTICYWPLRAWILGGALFATYGLLGAILGGALAAGTVSTLACQRSPQGNAASVCTITEVEQPLYADKVERTQTLPLSTIQAAKVKPLTEDNRPVYAVALVTTKGEVALKSLRGMETDAIAAVQQIQTFLQTPSQPTLNLVYRYNTLQTGEVADFLWRFGLMALPAVILLLSPGLILTFDTATQELRVLQWGGLQRWGKTTYPLAAVRQVESLSPPTAEDAQMVSLQPNALPIRLHLAAFPPIDLPPGNTAIADQRLVNQLRNFLNLPSTPSSPGG